MPRQVCFMVMPYGTKPTGAEPGRGPAEVDFNALWRDVFHPAITRLGYQPVRADLELGPLIITDMIQRLAIADLVIADISISNANVYYEVGVRHAAKETGCVLVAADWSQQVFDLGQIRHLRYPLAEKALDSATADALSRKLEVDIAGFVAGQSPVYAAVPGYPQCDAASANAFSDLMESVAEFQAKVHAALDRPPGDNRATHARALRDELLASQPMLPSSAVEMLFLLRDTTDWTTTLEFIDRLPPDVRESTVVREQRALAQSKSGNHNDAIAALLELITLRGETSERAGLVGGRYKKLYRQAVAAGETSDAASHLNKAIDWYTRGMNADLNDFFPASNLPRLLRTRNRRGDEEKAAIAAAVTRAGCERTLRREPNHPWVRQTLLGQAADAGDVAAVERLASEVAENPGAPWQLRTTDDDVRMSIALLPEERRAALEEALGNLQG
jgi:hypothetical protein